MKMLSKDSAQIDFITARLIHLYLNVKQYRVRYGQNNLSIKTPEQAIASDDQEFMYDSRRDVKVGYSSYYSKLQGKDVFIIWSYGPNAMKNVVYTIDAARKMAKRYVERMVA